MPSVDTEALVEVGGARLWTARRGAGAPLLLASGGPGCCDYLEPVAAMLDDLVEVVRFEQRGCGRSSAGGPYDLETGIADLDALRSHWGFERWAVGGHSWGGDLALCYALAHPHRVSALLMICAHGPHDDRSWSRVYHRTLDERGERLPDYRFPPNLDVNREANASFRESIRRPGLLREIADLDVPALVVTAGRDVRPAWPMHQLALLLPNATLRELSDAEHFAWLTHAAELGAVLREFVGSLLGDPFPKA